MISLLLLQAGRITCYAAAGAVVAGLSGLVLAPSLTATSYRILQWSGALTLMWIGLSTAGMLPRLALPSIGMASLAAFFRPTLSALQVRPTLGPLALGVGWGLTPCPMVYAALFTSALTDSSATGAAWMLGFGLGTIPGVLAAALGISALARIRRGPLAETTAGLAIAGFGFATVYFGWPLSPLICAPN